MRQVVLWCVGPCWAVEPGMRGRLAVLVLRRCGGRAVDGASLAGSAMCCGSRRRPSTARARSLARNFGVHRRRGRRLASGRLGRQRCPMPMVRVLCRRDGGAESAYHATLARLSAVRHWSRPLEATGLLEPVVAGHGSGSALGACTVCCPQTARAARSASGAGSAPRRRRSSAGRVSWSGSCAFGHAHGALLGRCCSRTGA